MALQNDKKEKEREKNCKMLLIIFELLCDKSNKITYASIKDSDQPGHLCCAFSGYVAKDLSFYHANSESSQTGQMPRLV